MTDFLKCAKFNKQNNLIWRIAKPNLTIKLSMETKNRPCLFLLPNTIFWFLSYFLTYQRAHAKNVSRAIQASKSLPSDIFHHIWLCYDVCNVHSKPIKLLFMLMKKKTPYQNRLFFDILSILLIPTDPTHCKKYDNLQWSAGIFMIRFKNWNLCNINLSILVWDYQTSQNIKEWRNLCIARLPMYIFPILSLIFFPSRTNESKVWGPRKRWINDFVTWKTGFSFSAILITSLFHHFIL